MSSVPAIDYKLIKLVSIVNKRKLNTILSCKAGTKVIKLHVPERIQDLVQRR